MSERVGELQRAKKAWQRLRAIGGVYRASVAFVACALALAAFAYGGSAQGITYFRIGTGSTAGTYFPIGAILASAISKPPGSRECAAGGSCGVPGLIAVAQSTEGSVANVTGIQAGILESGLSQADVAYWAYRGEGRFETIGPLDKLRAIANLFPESIHLVVRRGAGIRSVADVRGKRVSLDREGSGTRVDALLILEAYGIDVQDFQAEAFAAGDAADLLREGEIDGFFMVVGTPATAVADLANDSLVELVPITGEPAEKLLERYPFFARDTISSGTYFNVPAVETLSVGAQWLVSAGMPADLVYEITRATWHPNTRQLLDRGHPKGQLIQKRFALKGLGVPLHPGARRYYSEAETPFPGKPE